MSWTKTAAGHSQDNLEVTQKVGGVMQTSGNCKSQLARMHFKTAFQGFGHSGIRGLGVSVNFVKNFVKGQAALRNILLRARGPGQHFVKGQAALNKIVLRTSGP